MSARKPKVGVAVEAQIIFGEPRPITPKEAVTDANDSKTAHFEKMRASLHRIQKHVDNLERLTRPSRPALVFRYIASLAQPRHRIKPPVGSWLLGIADFFCSKRTLEKVLKPIVADMRHEHHEALLVGRTFKAEWMRAKYAVSFFWAIGLVRALEGLSAIWKRT